MSVPDRPTPYHDPHVPTGEWEAYDEDSAESLLPQVQDPVFPVTLRGYDRATVDAYVADVTRLVEELDATHSPTRAVERAIDRVGEETSGILQRARETAEDITTKSRSRSDDRLQTAEREAHTMRQQAEARVRELDADTERLWEERNRLLEDVTRLSSQLSGVVEAANLRYPLVEAEPAPTRPPSGDDQTVIVAGPGATEDGAEGTDDPEGGPAGGALTHEEDLAEEQIGEPEAWEGDPEDDVVGEADEPPEDDPDDDPGYERFDHDGDAAEVGAHPGEAPRRSPRFVPRDRYASPRPLHEVRRSSTASRAEARTPIFQRLLSLRPAGRP